MASPLLKVPAQVNKAFTGIFFSAVLTRQTSEGGDGWNPGVGDEVTYNCRALVSSWGQQELAGGLVTGNERKVLILAHSLLTQPQNGDEIEMQDGPFAGEKYKISDAPTGTQPAVKTDPAKAVWIVRASI